MPEAAKTRLQEVVDDITGYKRRMRRVVLALAACLAVSIAAGTVSLLGVLGNHHQGTAIAQEQQRIAVNQARITAATQALHQAQLTECADANELRAKQKLIWADFLALATGPHPSQAALQFEARFNPLLAQTFAPLDCARLYPDTPAGN